MRRAAKGPLDGFFEAGAVTDGAGQRTETQGAGSYRPRSSDAHAIRYLHLRGIRAGKESRQRSAQRIVDPAPAASGDMYGDRETSVATCSSKPLVTGRRNVVASLETGRYAASTTIGLSFGRTGPMRIHRR